LFSPDDKLRWDGNLKKFKYAVVDPDGAGTQSPEIIITGQGVPSDAIDPVTGFFRASTRSFWSDAIDGNNVGAGGAANELPDYTARAMYTFLGTNPGGTTRALLPIDDASVTAELVGAATAAERTAVLDFARARNAARMGDPMHSVPQVVTYGGTASAPIDVAYVATNDGFLHAVNAADSSGEELWSFVPQELLSRLKPLMDNPTTAHTYGLDGDVRVLRYDIDRDGVIESTEGDRVFLYVGMRRGGQFYYGLDVTNRTSPRMLFKLGPDQLPGVGETWSPPVIGRVHVNGASQNGQRFVLIFGGGYNAAQEGFTQVDDGTGNRIFMVDAKSGDLLWFAGATAIATVPNTTPNLVVAGMTNAIPGKITVLDTNGDGYSDRMYAADLGGRVFRFDITNGNGASSLVDGGVFAALGQGLAEGGSPLTPDMLHTRRFYNAPDVALFESRGSASYMTLSIGSGYRGHPLHRATQDRFYVLRDKNPFRKLTQSQYNALSPITDSAAGLIDITSNPVGANLQPADLGWKYTFPSNTGEKVLAEATTAGNTVMFTTYQPLNPDPAQPCRSQHRNRAYAFNVGSGRPAFDLNDNNTITNADLFETINHAGIIGGVNITVLRGELLAEYNRACQESGPTACQGENSGQQGKVVCQVGMHIMGRCVPVGEGGRNFWRRRADSGASP
jgi:type IV pilus assembly protein PilY1